MELPSALLARVLGLLAAGALAACGEAALPAPGPAPAEPQRILPANAGAVDLCTALLEPGRVVALPEAALEFSRLAAQDEAWHARPRFHGFDAETLLALHPDLVIAHGWQSPETLAILRESGIALLVLPLPRAWADVRAALLDCGRAVGEEERAVRVAEELDRRVATLRELARGRSPQPRALSYVNLGTGGWAAGAGTTADILLELAGLRNAAAEAGHEGHATLDLEALLALDPDVVIVGAAGKDGEGASPTAAYLRSEPSLSTLRAVLEGRIVALPERLFSTSSTELVAGAELLVRRLAQVQ